MCWWNQKTGLKLNCINPSVLLPNGIQKGVPTAIIDDVVNVWQANNLNINTMKYAWSDKKKFRLFNSLSAVLGSSVKPFLILLRKELIVDWIMFKSDTEEWLCNK